MVLTTCALGGLAGIWAAPPDLVSEAASCGSIILIVGGAVGGLLLGGLFILLCD
jgi:hypothetical protein